MGQLVRPIRIVTSILTGTTAVAEDPAWSGATNYAVAALVNRDIDGQGRRWKSKVNPNLNHDPATDDGTHWQDMGPSLPWRMYGASATRQTTAADSLEVNHDLPPTELIDTLWLGNLSGTEVHVVQTDVVEGVVFDETFDLISPSGITDPWRWAFEPIVRLKELTVTGLFPFAGCLVDVTISEAGATVGCGALVMGFSKSLGDTMWGASFGLKDYSTFVENDFGDEEPVERPYRKLASFTTNLDNSYVDELVTVLTEFRATPVLFIGMTTLTVSAVWGFASFKVDVPGPARSFCSLDVRSRAQ